MGLDHHYELSSRASQRRILESQLAIAAQSPLPLIIHCRQAYAETIAILREHGFPGRRVVFHCFTGSRADADAIADHGWLVSFTGIVTFRNASRLREVAGRYLPTHFLVETDSPYLSPEPVRHVRPNEPAHLVHTVASLAELRGVPVSEFAEMCRAGAAEFFSLDAARTGD